MDNYIVSARKYRPDSFDSVVGQDAITKTLKNSILLNQLAQAYLFCGPRGVGKTTCARIFAKTINCSNMTEDFEACNKCESCIAFNNSRSLNIHELDAASNNSVEDIRSLIDKVRVPPQIGKYSVYIVDEVHMLSTAAFNAFLKTLEEPPKHVIFILATTEKHKIIPTILSRCQIFDFNRISVEDIRSRLEYVAKRENIEAEYDALHIIAQKADGAMRDALSIFDQIVSFTGKKITYQDTIKNLNVLDYDTYFMITDALVSGNYVKAFQIVDNVIKRGFEANYFINGLSSHFRDLLLVKDTETINLLEVGENIKEKYIINSKKCSVQFLFKAIDIANTADLNYKTAQNKRLLIELALLKIANINNDIASKENNVEVTKNSEIHTSNSEKTSTTVQESKVENYNNKIISPQINENIISTDENKTTYIPDSNSSKKTTISLKDMLNQTIEKNNETYEEKSIASSENSNIGENDYDLNTIHKIWLNYAEYENKPRLSAFLKTNLPNEIEKNKFMVVVPNQEIKSYLDNLLPRTLDFIRRELNNKNFIIEYIVGNAEPNVDTKTPSEQFDELIKTNPDFKNLKEKLDLDLE